MFASSKKPYTAVTVHVERLTGPEYEENDYSGIVDLIEVIRIQDSGPTEAARAIRKKLKYGNSHRQIRALTILDGLIQNGGGRFQRTFADEALLERLRMLPRDEMVDADVKTKCNTLFRQWAAAYRNTQGLSAIAQLHTQLPKRTERRAKQSKVLRETEEDAQNNPFDEADCPPTTPAASRKQSVSGAAQQSSAGPSSWLTSSPSNMPPPPSISTKSSSKSNGKSKKHKHKHKPFNLEKEKSSIMQAIASASVASTGLLNALKLINRETGALPSTNHDAVQRFETCKILRRQILRYIQLVESDQWIGSLLNANDELVKALMAFEVLEKGIDDDSDSETEAAVAAINDANLVSSPSARRHSHIPTSSISQQRASSTLPHQLSNLSLQDEEPPPAKPPRPRGQSLGFGHLSMQAQSTPLAAIPGKAPPVPGGQPHQLGGEESESEEEDDDNDPFGDQNAIK